MADYSHTLIWDEDSSLFRCSIGACSFTKYWQEVEAAGYIARKVGSLFISAKDFEPEVPCV